MSNVVTGMVRRRKVGSPTQKAVLLFMADCASDDGSGVWISKSHIADDLEMGRRTVQLAIAALVEAGLVFEAGRRKRHNGYTVEYAVNLSAVEALPSTRSEASKAPAATCAGDAHAHEMRAPCAGDAQQSAQEVHTNLPKTIHKPPSSKKDASADVRGPLEEVATPKAVASFLAYRRKSKAGALTSTAATRLAASLRTIFDSGGDPDDALGLAEERGWRTVKPEWYFKEKADDNRTSSNQSANSPGHSADRIIAFAARAGRTPSSDCF